jgi:outer membrane protein OmpA-like peptidoglycan-associated protein
MTYFNLPVKAFSAMLIYLVFINQTLAQNSIENGSFEKIESCPVWKNNLKDNIPGISLPTNAKGDFFNSCGSPDLSTPKNYKGNQEPADGEGYIGLYFYTLNDYREYIQLNINEQLEKGDTYRLQFKVSLSETSKVGLASFSAIVCNNPIKVQNNKNLDFSRLALIPNLKFQKVDFTPDNKLSQTKKWVTITAEFIASGEENHIVFGNFSDNKSSELLQKGTAILPHHYAYYFVDDASLKNVQPKFVRNKTYKLKNENFDPKGYKLDRLARENVKRIYKYLKRNSKTQLRISGFAYDNKSAEYNKFVSSLRARAVALYLKKMGIKEERIVWKGEGDKRGELDIDKVKSKSVEFVITEFEDN